MRKGRLPSFGMAWINKLLPYQHTLWRVDPQNFPPAAVRSDHFYESLYILQSQPPPPETLTPPPSNSPLFIVELNIFRQTLLFAGFQLSKEVTLSLSVSWRKRMLSVCLILLGQKQIKIAGNFICHYSMCRRLKAGRISFELNRRWS